MLIRYFAATDRSDIGLLALEYLKGFLRVRMPVRVASMTGTPVGPWERYSQLLATPLSSPYVNAVCCDPARWVWRQRVPMRTRKADGTVAVEMAIGTNMLWTQGALNILFTTWNDLLRATQEQIQAARKYERAVIPQAPGGAIPQPFSVIPVPIVDDGLSTLRTLLHLPPEPNE